MIGNYWEAEATPELMAKFKKIKDSSWKRNKAKPLSLLWKKYTN